MRLSKKTLEKELGKILVHELAVYQKTYT